MNNYIKLLKKLINNNEEIVVCFDFFDTIVSRTISPDEIKRIWAKNCSIYYFDGLVSWKELFSSRIKCESQLYNCKDNNYEFKYNDLLSLVYNEFSNRANACTSNISLESFLNYSNKCEIEIEIASQYINKDTLDVIDYCHHNDINMLIISDYYFGENTLLEFLSKYNIANWFSKCFVSCDYLLSKRKGDLYKLVKSMYSSKKLIMFGDNIFADINNSQKFGFYGIHINRKKEMKKYKQYDENSKMIVYSKLNKLYKSKSSFLSNYAFSLYLFIERLYKETQKNNIEDLCFFARDSELLQILFDEYKKNRKFNKPIKTHYLLVSRNSTYLPSCQRIDSESFDGIFSHYDYLKIKDFLISLSFDKTQIYQILSELNVSEDFVFKNDDYKFLNKIKNCESFRRYYELNRLASRKIFIDYLKQEIKKLDRLYIVDVGWRGTIQDNLYFSLNKKSNIQGYYFGLTQKRNIMSNNIKKGLIFSFQNHNDSFDTFYEFEYWFIENILTGSHGKVNNYKLHNGRIEAEMQEDSDSILFENYISDLRKEIVNKFRKIDEIFSNTCYFADDFAIFFAKVHFRITHLYPIHKKKDNYIIRYLHSEGFGLITSVKSIPKSGWIRYFLRMYGSSYIYRTIKEYKINIIELDFRDFLELLYLSCSYISTRLVETITNFMNSIKSFFQIKKIKRKMKIVLNTFFHNRL